MRKLLLILSPFLLSILIFGTAAFFLSDSSGKGALQVTSHPKSQVFLNGKLIGETPFCKCELPQMIESGEYAIRLVPKEGDFPPFEEKIKITKSVLTAVDRTFGTGATSHGSIITLIPIQEKKANQLLVLSYPDKAQVLLDSSIKGEAPLLLKDITDSDHTLVLKKEGYREKTLRIRAVSGYKLEALIFLAVETLDNTPSASVSALPKKQTVTILPTPLGFLRVRAGPSLSEQEIGRVSENESFELISEVDGWFEILFEDKKQGFISSQYARKDEDQPPMR